MGGSRGRGRERGVGRASAEALHILRSASMRGAGAEVSGQPAAGESLATSGWPSFERIVLMTPGRGATNLASPDGPTTAGGVWPWSEGGLAAAAADKAIQQTSRSNTRNDVARPPPPFADDRSRAAHTDSLPKRFWQSDANREAGVIRSTPSPPSQPRRRPKSGADGDVAFTRT